jgi:hypothetical protein
MPSPYLRRQFSGPLGIADRGRGAEGAALTGRKGGFWPITQRPVNKGFAVLQMSGSNLLPFLARQLRVTW